MKKRLLTILLSALLVANMSACGYVPSREASNAEKTIESENKMNTLTNVLESQEKSISSILEDILQQQYTWSEFNFIHPKYEITARSQVAVNIIIPEFENVIFVFSGNLEDNIPLVGGTNEIFRYSTDDFI